jgi:hypothetical protein
MLKQKIGNIVDAGSVGGEAKHKVDYLGSGSLDRYPIGSQENTPGQPRRSLIAIDKGLVIGDRTDERGRLIERRGIQIDSAKGLIRLVCGGIQKLRRAYSSLADQSLVDLQDLICRWTRQIEVGWFQLAFCQRVDRFPILFKSLTKISTKALLIQWLCLELNVDSLTDDFRHRTSLEQ